MSVEKDKLKVKLAERDRTVKSKRFCSLHMQLGISAKQGKKKTTETLKEVAPAEKPQVLLPCCSFKTGLGGAAK